MGEICPAIVYSSSHKLGGEHCLTLFQDIFQQNIGKTGSPFGLQRGTQPSAAAKKGDHSPKELGRKGSRKDIASVKALELLDKYKRQALKGMENPCPEEVSHHCGYARESLLHR